MIGFFLAGAVAAGVASATEWAAHKYILHGLGKKKDSYFHYHWKHHHTCRKNDGVDDIYKNWRTNTDVHKEITTLVALTLFNSTWLFVWPALFFWFTFFTVSYFFLHAYSHTNVEWGKRWMPWHYEHHMNRNQDANWGVTQPWFDWLTGTREKG